MSCQSYIRLDSSLGPNPGIEVTHPMTILPNVCPECGDVVHGTCEIIPGTAVLHENDDGSFEYSGWTDVCWDGQRSEYVGDQIRVCCEQGHEWLALATDTE